MPECHLGKTTTGMPGMGQVNNPPLLFIAFQFCSAQQPAIKKAWKGLFIFLWRRRKQPKAFAIMLLLVNLCANSFDLAHTNWHSLCYSKSKFCRETLHASYKDQNNLRSRCPPQTHSEAKGFRVCVSGGNFLCLRIRVV